MSSRTKKRLNKQTIIVSSAVVLLLVASLAVLLLRDTVMQRSVVEAGSADRSYIEMP